MPTVKIDWTELWEINQASELFGMLGNYMRHACDLTQKHDAEHTFLARGIPRGDGTQLISASNFFKEENEGRRHCNIPKEPDLVAIIHTHPRMCGPSPTDMATSSQAAAFATHDIYCVVISINNNPPICGAVTTIVAGQNGMLISEQDYWNCSKQLALQPGQSAASRNTEQSRQQRADAWEEFYRSFGYPTKIKPFEETPASSIELPDDIDLIQDPRLYTRSNDRAIL